MIIHRTWIAVGAGALLLALAGCGERPPMDTKQIGYRGTGMEQVSNPRLIAKDPAQAVPTPQPPAPADGPRAKEVFKNVQVLGDLSAGEFTRHMVAITAWVSPKEGCNYCHKAGDLADDSVYTKVVARKMIQMTQHLNANWKNHVGNTGVTCYTCHRGNPVPQYITTAPTGTGSAARPMLGYTAGQNMAAGQVGLTSLPGDPFGEYLDGDAPIRVNTKGALPADNERDIKDTEHTYALMMHMSQALGVNCTYCHNTRSFASWEGPPQRVGAYHGIRMVRDVNNAYLKPLASTFPANRKGPTGDVYKVACSTCHQGQPKPLGGANMVKDHPELAKPVAAAATVKTAAAAAPAAPAPLPAPVAEARRSVLYFAVGSPVLAGEQAKGLDRLVATMASDARAKATISGYHSASGSLDTNQELAKQRAFTVRDAMLAAGVKPARVVLAKPQQASANLSGEDAASRRVEVTVSR